MFNPITQDEFNPEEFIQVLDNEQPYMWKAWRGVECEAVKLYRADPWKKTNRIIVSREAMLWHSFHNPETWDGMDIDDCRDNDEPYIEWTWECEGYDVVERTSPAITEFSCPINYDDYIRTTVWQYFGGR